MSSGSGPNSLGVCRQLQLQRTERKRQRTDKKKKNPDRIHRSFWGWVNGKEKSQGSFCGAGGPLGKSVREESHEEDNSKKVLGMAKFDSPQRARQLSLPSKSTASQSQKVRVTQPGLSLAPFTQPWCRPANQRQQKARGFLPPSCLFGLEDTCGAWSSASSALPSRSRGLLMLKAGSTFLTGLSFGSFG